MGVYEVFTDRAGDTSGLCAKLSCWLQGNVAEWNGAQLMPWLVTKRTLQWRPEVWKCVSGTVLCCDDAAVVARWSGTKGQLTLLQPALARQGFYPALLQLQVCTLHCDCKCECGWLCSWCFCSQVVVGTRGVLQNVCCRGGSAGGQSYENSIRDIFGVETFCGILVIRHV